MDDNFLERKLQERMDMKSLRQLRPDGGGSDFYSNDYLGIVRNGLIENELQGTRWAHGSTGSRLLAGNSRLAEETEREIAAFHDAGAALLFNSGYDANCGLMACIAARGDTIFYDRLCHASLRDGIRLSFAHAISFDHNDVDDLKKKWQNRKGNCFVVTESVFSMDGDRAPLEDILSVCEDCLLIVDEAHATGVTGEKGEGLVQSLGIQSRCFARVHTFGKALGVHGAAILGSVALRDYLINFCRPLIYSTALPPVAVAAIRATYKIFPEMHRERAFLQKLISCFDLPGFKKSDTPVQCFLEPGNEKVKMLSSRLAAHGLDVRPILYPTVPAGEERLRIALHSFNSEEEVRTLVSLLAGSH